MTVLTALSHFGEMAVSFCKNVIIANYFLILKLDSFTFHNMYVLCFNFYEVKSVFDPVVGVCAETEPYSRRIDCIYLKYGLEDSEMSSYGWLWKSFAIFGLN